MSSAEAQRAYPILTVSTTDGGARTGLNPYYPGRQGPGGAAQRGRLAPRFAALQAAMANERLQITTTIDGYDPELVVVLEVRDSITDFQAAVRGISGLEFLAEVDEGEEEPDEGFTTRDGDLIPLSFYVVAQNQRALQQLLSMWDRWCSNPSVTFDTGLYPWKRVFDMLKDVRPWNAQDRLQGTTIVEVWQQLLNGGATSVTGEIELWFRDSANVRREVEDQLRAELAVAGCAVVDALQIPAIAYHAVLARFPADVARQLLAGDGAIINNPRIAAARPQSIGLSSARLAPPTQVPPVGGRLASGSPLVAILDGVPLEGHDALRGRIAMDDPHDFAGRVEARQREHGTGVASGVIWGDLARGDDPLDRPVVVHPIFVVGEGHDGIVTEAMPEDRLPVGVIHRALHRILRGTAQSPAVSPAVRVVVLAAGHTALPFGSRVSPWGRLLDAWSSARDVLFIVSAGNYRGAIELGHDAGLDLLDDLPALRQAVQQALFESAHERRILSPADSVNSLTVGARHSDAADYAPAASLLDVMGDERLPSPTSALGGGFNRQVKPDVFADGGRVHYRQRLDADHVHLEEALGSDTAPGILVAAPGAAGQTDRYQWMQGTSAATAVIGHAAGRVASVLSSTTPAVVDPDFIGVATKALIVNAASWSRAHESIGEVLNIADPAAIRRSAARLLGFGAVDVGRIAECGPQRVTLVATGRVAVDRAREVELPVPPSLSGRQDWRRVSATLAWFTPINPRHRSYRSARLWLEPVNLTQVGLRRSEVDHNAVKRGSTHHEQYEGVRRMAYGDDTAMRFRVNCTNGAGELSGAVAFALVLTFEVEEESAIPVYDEIAVAIRSRTRVITRTAV